MSSVSKARLIGITGSSGMIGARLLPALLAADDTVRVRCLVRHPQLRKPSDRVEYLVGDLLSEADCDDFVTGLDVVVHLAQSNSPVSSNRHWPSDLSGNLLLSVHLLEALRQRRKPCHFVYASSGGAIYGNHPDVVNYDEDLPCRPLSPYGIQKLAVEHYLRLAVAQGWLTARVLRISNAYGSLLPAERRQGLIGVAVGRHLAKLPVDLFGSAETIRDYIHIDDVTTAILLGLAGHDGCSVMNISSGEGHSVRQILDILGEVSGREVDVHQSEFGEQQFALTPRTVLDNSRARKALGWNPSVPLRGGIQRLWIESIEE